jgi:hypothetical protein
MVERDFRFFHARRCELVIECSRKLKPESTTCAETV